MRFRVRFDEAGKDAGERWITVHPHGDDQKGQPVLVRVNPTNPRQGHIIGGAGGSLNLQRVNLRTPAEYKRQAADRRRERRDLSREERSAGREGAHREVQKQHAERRREALIQMLRLGGHSGDLTAPSELTEGLEPAAARKVQKDHEAALFRQARAMVNDARRYLARNAIARREAGLGNMPMRGGEDSLGADDLLTSREMRRGLGYTPEYAKLTSDEETAARLDAMRSQLKDDAVDNPIDAGIMGRRIAKIGDIAPAEIESAPPAAIAGFAQIAARRLEALDAALDAEALVGRGEDPIPEADREQLDAMAARMRGSLTDALTFTSDPQNADQTRDWLQTAARHGLLSPATAEAFEKRERAARFEALGAPAPETLTKATLDNLHGDALTLMVQEAAKAVRSTPGTDADLRRAAAAASGDIAALGRDRRNLAEEGIVIGELGEDEQRAFLHRALDLGLVGTAPPADLPEPASWTAPVIASPDTARAMLLMGRKLRQLRSSAQDAARRIDAGEEVDGLTYNPSIGEKPWVAPRGGTTEPVLDAHPPPELVDEIQQEVRTQRARSFLQNVDATYDTAAEETATTPEDAQRDLSQHLSWGTNQAVTEHAQSILRDAALDRQAVDLLGSEGAAKLLAWHIHQHRGEHVDAISQAIDDHHKALQDSMIPDAMDAAREAYEHAHEIQTGMQDATDDLTGWKALHDERIKKLDVARRTLGRALGYLETTAALNAALRMSPAKQIVCQLGAVDEARAAAHAKSIGLDPSDYELDTDGGNTWLTVRDTGFAKMVRPYDGREAREAEAVRAIKAGEQDEDGWMPHGFAKRSDPPPFKGQRPAPHAQPLDYQLSQHGSMHDAVASFIKQRVHDGWRPVDIMHELQRTAHHGAQLLAAHGDAEHDAVARWRAENPEPQKSDPLDMFGGGAPTAEWQAWNAARAQVAAAPRIQEFQAAIEAHAPARSAVGGRATLDVAERYGPAFQKLAASDASPETLDGQILDETHARDAAFRALSRHPAAVGAFKDPSELTSAERVALRETFYRYFHPKAGDASVARPEDRIQQWQAENPEPAREAETLGMFGALGMSERASDEEIAKAKARADAASTALDEAHARHAAAAAAAQQQDIDGGAQQALGEARAALQAAHYEHEQATRHHEALEDQGASDEWRAWKKRRSEAMAQYRAEHSAATPPEWDTYVATHGGAHGAYRAVQDLVKGRLFEDFQGHYEALAGTPLRRGITAIRGSDRHRVAFDPEWRDHVQRARSAAAASVHDRDAAGRFVEDQVRAKRDRLLQEQQARQERQTSALDQPAARPETPGHGERAALGRNAEAAIADIVRSYADVVDPTQPFAARTASFSGAQHVKRQRAVKMIERQKKIGLFVGTGGGKTSIALAGLAHLRGQGKAKRGLYAVPSIVQGQFGSEALSFIDPKSMRWHARPGETREDRLKAMADPDRHAVVFTHQSLRDDVTHLVATHLGMPLKEVVTKMTGYDENDTKTEAWTRDELDAKVREALAAHGAGDLLDYLAVDEGDIALNRKGKRDSHMARVIDSLMRNSRHGAMMTGTPVKNDVSELYDQLAKVAHHKYHDGEGGVSRAEFLRRYGNDPAEAGRALRAEISRYSYTAEVDHGLTPRYRSEVLPMTAAESSRAEQIESAYAAVEEARRRGEIDMDAARRLAPHTFDRSDDHEATAAAIHAAAAPFREQAYNRVINIEPGAKIERIRELAREYKASGRKEGVVFARNLESVDAIRSALEADGHRVMTLTGRDPSKVKAKKRADFDDGRFDILVLSDAGASGANLQSRATWLVEHDQPQTYRTQKQRRARIVRGGQRFADPAIHALATDHPWEDQNRARLERKRALHEMLFEGQDETHDETGLAGRIRQHLRDRTSAA